MPSIWLRQTASGVRCNKIRKVVHILAARCNGLGHAEAETSLEVITIILIFLTRIKTLVHFERLGVDRFKVFEHLICREQIVPVVGLWLLGSHKEERDFHLFDFKRQLALILDVITSRNLAVISVLLTCENERPRSK